MEQAVKIDQPAPISDVESRIDRIFNLQRSHRYKMGATNARERIARLKRLQSVIMRRRKDIQAALYADFRKPAAEVDLSEILVMNTEIKHTIKHLKGWMKPRKVRPTLALFTTSSLVRHEPRGVVLIISPWNYPINLAFGPLVSAIAAGNCAILKPSELAPHSARIIGEICREIFPEEEVAVFEGDKKVAASLLKKPFNHIFFTGSPRVGKIVMKAAAEHLSSVTLELGGKSPAIIDRGANIPDAATKIAWGKFSNTGQTCIAPDYVYVHRSQFPRFIEELKKAIRHYYGESETARRNSPDYARIIDPHHHHRIRKLISGAVKDGAKIEFGGETETKDRYIAPTVLVNVSQNSQIMQEEIFGPVLPVLIYDKLDDVVNNINSGESPLAIYIFGKSRQRIRQIFTNTASGTACVNEVLLQYLHPNLPFGGINFSGIGNSHGYYGFRAFSHERPVLKHHRFSALKLMMPPYSKAVQKLINLGVKYL